MSYIYKTILASGSNFGVKRDTANIKYIVIHCTGNDGDTSAANARYFQGSNRSASAHYFVDDTSVVQSVPDDYVAWHCGGDNYYSECRNSTSIGVEMCDTAANGVHDLSEETRQNTISLVRELMAKYGVPIERIIRHYDVTHKVCPAYFVNNEAAWIAFKDEINNIRNIKMEDINMTLKELITIDDTGDVCSEWAKGATDFCVEKGIFSGDGNGNYGWKKPITREAMAVVLVKVLEQTGLKDNL